MIVLALAALAALARPTITYEVRVDSAHPEAIAVTLDVRHGPPRILLAMKVHPEYDARFWRYLQFTSGRVSRVDTTLWEALLPGGSGRIAYQVRLPMESDGTRRAWRCVVRADGALINPPDVLLYLPAFPAEPATIKLEAPASWTIATSLASSGARSLRAASAAELLDAPIMLGHLRQWSFVERGTRFVVAYWPLPDAARFDTATFVANLRLLTRTTLDVFRTAPTRRYVFLVQDGAGDALEHQASLTIGIPSATLARDVRARLPETAHEFFHTWNLVAIRPDSFGELLYGRTPPTSGLWLGEGVTLHYADVLLRRAGLADGGSSRATHLEELLSRYYAAPWAQRVSPAAASRAFGRSPLADDDATGGYYLQGELLGEALDAAIRDSTHERQSLDDAMRRLYAASGRRTGLTSGDIERVFDDVCSCRLDGIFRTSIDAPGLIDLEPATSRLGWRIVVDTVQATDARGAPAADLRIGATPVDDSTVAFVVANPASAWAEAGVRTGDVIVGMNGARPSNVGAVFAALRAWRIGDTVSLDVRRHDAPMHFGVVLRGYRRPRARLLDASTVTLEQRARRLRWLQGW